MLGGFENIYIIGDISAIANEYNKLCELAYDHPECILDPQEYGINCYCYINLDNSYDWDYVLKHSPSDEWYHYHQRRAKFIDYIRDNVPSGVTQVLAEVSY